MVANAHNRVPLKEATQALNLSMETESNASPSQIMMSHKLMDNKNSQTSSYTNNSFSRGFTKNHLNSFKVERLRHKN